MLRSNRFLREVDCTDSSRILVHSVKINYRGECVALYIFIFFALLTPRPLQAQTYINLPVRSDNVEATWTSALAEVLHGRQEFAVKFGRVDLLTDVYAIEVDRFDKYHEAIGQALHYRVETSRQGAIALMLDDGIPNLSKVKYIHEALCRPLDLAMFILLPIGIEEDDIRSIQGTVSPYWISRTGKIHNSDCRYYRKGVGVLSKDPPGENCKICGGRGFD